MKYQVTLKGKVYEIEVEKGQAMLLNEYEAAAPVLSAPPAPAAAPAPVAAAPSAPAPVAGSGNAVPSPLPGTVINIKIAPGQTVKQDEVVMIIEAMKMENEVTAPRAGTVTAVLVQKGAAVQTGTPLFELK